MLQKCVHTKKGGGKKYTIFRVLSEHHIGDKAKVVQCC